MQTSPVWPSHFWREHCPFILGPLSIPMYLSTPAHPVTVSHLPVLPRRAAFVSISQVLCRPVFSWKLHNAQSRFALRFPGSGRFQVLLEMVAGGNPSILFRSYRFVVLSMLCQCSLLLNVPLQQPGKIHEKQNVEPAPMYPEKKLLRNTGSQVPQFSRLVVALFRLCAAIMLKNSPCRFHPASAHLSSRLRFRCQPTHSVQKAGGIWCTPIKKYQKHTDLMADKQRY